MNNLGNIRKYVEKIANIISTVVDMNVLICDTSLRIIGDADHQGVPCEEIELLSKNSVCYICLNEKKPVYYVDAKTENKGCRECSKRNECDTISIIAIPILINNEVIGSIALYASKGSSHMQVVNKREYLYNFLEQISELIILKLKDQERELENKIIRSNMSETINAIPYPIVNIDKLGNIKEYNKHFESFIGREIEYYTNINSLLRHIGNDKLGKF